MTRSRLTSALVLAGVAAVLALSVGLVESGGRGVAHERRSGAFEAGPSERAEPELRAPEIPPADVAEVPWPPEHAEEPAREPRAATARLAGLVTLQDGQPASEARVALGLQHARCDRDGRFELALAEPGDADLIAYAPGFEPALRAHFGANLAPGRDGQVHLVLGAPTQSIAGTVVDRTGAPLKSWAVELEGPDPLADFGLREGVRTDGDGRFLLTDVSAGVHFLRAWLERPESATRSGPVAAGEPAVVIVAE